MKNYNKVIGIDPGISGGIVVWTAKHIGSNKMPSYKVRKSNGKFRNETNIKEFQQILEEQCEGYEVIIFIELVQAWTGKDDVARQYQISKMLANYEAIKTVIKMSNIDFVQVRPQDWQTYLNLKVKGEESSQRKLRYKRFAQERYPKMKATAWNGDAACLVEFGRRKLAWFPQWVEDRLPHINQPKLL